MDPWTVIQHPSEASRQTQTGHVAPLWGHPVSSRALSRKELKGELRHGDAAHGPHAPAMGMAGPTPAPVNLTLSICAATEADAPLLGLMQSPSIRLASHLSALPEIFGLGNLGWVRSLSSYVGRDSLSHYYLPIQTPTSTHGKAHRHVASHDKSLFYSPS